MIYTGHDPVTFTNWTLGDSPAGFPAFSNVLTVANNAFTSAKLILNNLAGTANSNLTVSSPAAVNGTLVLTGASTYGGAGNGGSTIIGTNTTGNPALQADDGAGLPANSFLLLNGGVLQTSGSFTRPLAASFGHNVSWNIGGGGFSAIGSQLTVDIGGAGAQLAWGDSTLATGNPDLGSKILGPLKFGSVGSNAKTLFVDPIDLNPAGVASPTRTITVTAGLAGSGGGGDSTELSGVISSSNDPVGTPATLTKNGTGTLILSAANTYTGPTTISAGKLLANNTSGSATGTGAITVATGATLGGTGTVSGAVTNNGIIAPGASVGTLSAGGGVTDGANSSWSIELSGATADKLAVTGSIDLSASDSLNVTGTGTGTSWIIGTYTGSLTGTFDTITPGYSVTYTGGNVTLNAVPVGLPGDFNSDGKVDAGDYVIWRKNEGPNATLPNDNGVGNQAARFSLWRSTFGNGGPGSGSGLSGDGAVPEPSSFALLMLSFAAMAGRRRKR
jgi:autotransporter-associated beta strand protein